MLQFVNSLPTNARLLITFANSLDPDQARQTVWHSDGIPERIFQKKLTKKHENFQVGRKS